MDTVLDPTAQGNEHSVESNMPESTNNHGTALSDGSQRLSLGKIAATPLSPSSPVSSPLKTEQRNGTSSTPGPQELQNSPSRRTPSSSTTSNIQRIKTPTLKQRTSLSSLHSVGSATPPRSPALRRTSSNVASSSSPNSGAKSDLSATAEEPTLPNMTATSIARDFLGRELGSHHDGVSSSINSKTVAILQDNCYGHRYSRPRTSRAGLSSIVERPERIHASILGLAAAYVRLGGRHAEGHSPPHPKRTAKSPPPFKIHKTKRKLPLASQATINIHGLKWMNELKAMCEAAETKLAMTGKELTRPTSSEQTNGDIRMEKPKLHEGDLYLCSESLEALEGALGGVCEGIDAVFDESCIKRAFVCIRPPGHHCSADYPSGFCWLNNVHVGIGHAALAHGLTHAAIIDFDLHHGDGSQSITWAHNTRIASLPKNTPMSKKTAIGYFSLHDINSYPCEMGDEEKVRNASLCLENAHGQTIWNVHLQPWKTEAEFWRLYEERYMVLLSKARLFLRSHTNRLRSNPIHPQPKAAIFLSAGFDASEWESPGMQRHQVNVPTDFYARFTQDVVRLAEEDGLGVDGRVISVLEGGYSDRALMSGVLSHLSGLTSNDQPPAVRPSSNGLGQDMARRLGSLHINGQVDRNIADTDEHVTETFDAKWWAIDRLEEIENLVNPPAPAAAPKKQRPIVPPTYSSTTQSFSAKVITPPAGRRSLSGSTSYFHSAQCLGSKVPEQPPPPVSWAVAAHELSKLLIPSDRQTKSCKPEELNAEASRARKARHSTIGLPLEVPTATITADAAPDGKRMQLRDRTGKAPKYASDEEEDKPRSKANRRRTIADPALLIESSEDAPAKQMDTSPKKPAVSRGRRISAASSMTSTSGENTYEKNADSLSVSQPRKEPLVVRKTRLPSETRSDAPRAKPARKPPPVPRVPSAYSTIINPAPPVLQEDKMALAKDPNRNSQDIDGLSSGLKKMSIKLNMPSKEVQEANEAKQKPVARGRPKAMAPKTVKPAQAKTTADSGRTASVKVTTDDIRNKEPDQASEKAEEQGLSTGARPLPAIQSEAPVREAVAQHSRPLTTTDAALSRPDAHMNLTAAKDANVPPTSFAAPSAPAIQAPVVPSMSVDAPHTDLPLPDLPQSPERDHNFSPTSPNSIDQKSNTMAQSPPPSTPKRTRHELPFFSAHSPIFFGKPKSDISSIDVTLSAEASAGKSELATPIMQLTGLDTEPRGTAAATNQQEIGSVSANSKTEQLAEASIWDVPETPEPRHR